MKQGLILVHSKYGAARQYAQWLEQSTGFRVSPVKQTKPEALLEWETVVLVGGVYASGIGGLGWLKKHPSALQGKKLGVFAVGASPREEETLRLLKQRNFPPFMEEVPLFYGRGIWDLSKMSPLDRLLCRMLQKSLEKKPREECQLWELALKEAGQSRQDWTDPAYLRPLLDWLGQE